jgi:hypothetical protein
MFISFSCFSLSWNQKYVFWLVAQALLYVHSHMKEHFKYQEAVFH